MDEHKSRPQKSQQHPYYSTKIKAGYYENCLTMFLPQMEGLDIYMEENFEQPAARLLYVSSGGTWKKMKLVSMQRLIISVCG